MADILTLTVNPTVDISTSVARVAPIHKLRCAPPRRDPGGGGINVARVAIRFGSDVRALCAAGGITGKLLCDLLAREAIPHDAVIISEETRESFTVFEDTSGREYRFVLPGPHLQGHEWRQLLDALAGIERRPRFVVASGSLPPGVPSDFYANVIRICRGWNAQAILDTSGPPLEAALREGVYLVKPNLRELRELVREPLADEASQIAACKRLTQSGRAEIVALTLGAEGALLVTRDRVLRAEALAIDVRSTVGAGDSFLGAMVWSFAGGATPEDALRYGIAGGSAALLSPGTGLCSRDNVERLLAQIVIETC